MSEQQKALWFEREYTGSASNVIKSVLLGKADAGAVFTSELEREQPEVRDRLRPVFKTPPVAPHPISTHPRVPRAVQEAVKKEILSLAATRDGIKLLKTLRLSSPVPADYARDYQPLEKIDVKALSNWGE